MAGLIRSFSPIKADQGGKPDGEAGGKRSHSGPIGGAKAGRRDGQRDKRTAHPHPTGLPPDLPLGAAVNGEKYPLSKNM